MRFSFNSHVFQQFEIASSINSSHFAKVISSLCVCVCECVRIRVCVCVLQFNFAQNNHLNSLIMRPVELHCVAK